ncbi:hypothetical protein SERLADRAFT_434679 [Serpula lacrymans var. lacrymans S7.9]|uniref:F-box domain-containing protein n=1 Tax=Serpula lacrymans var. lacrymans (strain S7.9) TaxID=578457 RepID=F8NKK8_SERL9|nr:uncharacterized protein SERLADRAFT_434679 [Serpula lacrymans var. lacrymans S7.9]EGO28780.1 hypothetical protein SERLADRAFT_434679 [Serpula lacrymans var. lacrymans S7.9]
MDPSTATFPVLPPELERDIFELAAYTNRPSALCLVCVAKRAQIWLEPIIYSTIIIDSGSMSTLLLRTLSPSHDDEKKGQASHSRARTIASRINTLVLPRSTPLAVAEQLVPLCTNLQTLACWVSPTDGSAMKLEHVLRDREREADKTVRITGSKMKTLTHASINLTTFLGSPPNSPSGLSSTSLPFLSHLTHLDIVNHWAMWTLPISTASYAEHEQGPHPLLSLPCLTHVAFRYWARGSVGAVLERCKALRVIVLRVENVVWGLAKERLRKEGVRWVGSGWESVEECDALAEDRMQGGGSRNKESIRVVVMHHRSDLDEWERVQRGEEGMWERAERALRMKTLAGQ